MKVLNFLAAICLICFLVSCGDSSCDVSDWTGTWTLDEESVEDCSNGDDLTEVFSIIPGDSINSIIVEGELTVINTEDCTFTLNGVTAELDGQEIKVVLGDCEAIFR